MQEKNWTAGVDIGREITQVSYMAEGMKEPETLDQLFPTSEDMSFLKDCLLAIPGLDDLALLQSLELVLAEFTSEKAEKVRTACEEMGIDGKAVHLQGIEEASVYFALSQEKSLWSNDVIFFDFSKEALVYRSLHVENRNGSITARLSEEKLEGMDVKQPSDEMFLRLARERLDKRLISAVYLIGEGFYGGDWAKESLKYLCSRRRVFKGLNLYTKGAAYAAYDRIHSHAYDQVLFLCRNRLKASVGIRIVHKDEPKLLYLVRAGMNWNEARAVIEAVPDEISELTILLRSWQGEEAEEHISLEEFPVRERRMTRLEISLVFSSEEHGIFTIRDLGFGSLVPASDIVVHKDIRIMEAGKREQVR